MNRITAPIHFFIPRWGGGDLSVLKGGKYLSLRSLALSFLVHLVIFQTFVFTFSLGPAAPKPHFVFLGAILNPQDVAGWSYRGDTPLEERERGKSLWAGNGDKKFIYESREMTEGPFQMRVAEKPLFAGHVDSREKITVQSTFLTSQKRGETPTDKAPDIMPGHEPVPYKPLRLSP